MILLFSSCAYYPHLTSIPLIKEKGELKLEGGISVLPPLIRTSVSYGITNNLAFQVAGDIGGNNNYYVQSMLGFFRNIKKNNVIELYGGFGYEYNTTYNDANSGHLSGNSQFYFLQFDYGRIKKKIEYGVGLKSGYLHSKMTDNNFYECLVNQPYKSSLVKMNNIVIEPTVFLRFGWENFKIQTGIGGCWIFKLNHTEKKTTVFPNKFWIRNNI
jgi:hypothetical protein